MRFFRKQKKHPSRPKSRAAKPRLILKSSLRRDLKRVVTPGAIKKLAARQLPMLSREYPVFGALKRPDHRKDVYVGLYRNNQGDLDVPMQDLPGLNDHRHCVERAVRKQVLFASGVAGRNKKKSPGQGGSYAPPGPPC